MFTLIKKTSVHKDTKVVSNQKYDAILGRIYTISHLLSLERLNRISKNPRHVKSFFRGDFLEAILHSTNTFFAVSRPVITDEVGTYGNKVAPTARI